MGVMWVGSLAGRFMGYVGGATINITSRVPQGDFKGNL